MLARRYSRIFFPHHPCDNDDNDDDGGGCCGGDDDVDDDDGGDDDDDEKSPSSPSPSSPPPPRYLVRSSRPSLPPPPRPAPPRQPGCRAVDRRLPLQAAHHEVGAKVDCVAEALLLSGREDYLLLLLILLVSLVSSLTPRAQSDFSLAPETQEGPIFCSPPLAPRASLGNEGRRRARTRRRYSSHR